MRLAIGVFSYYGVVRACSYSLVPTVGRLESSVHFNDIDVRFANMSSQRSFQIFRMNTLFDKEFSANERVPNRIEDWNSVVRYRQAYLAWLCM